MEDSGLNEFGTDASTAKPTRHRNNRPAELTEAPSAGDEKEQLFSAINLTQWAICGQNTFKPVSITFPTLRKGVYNVEMTQYHGIVFKQKNVKVDDLLRFPDSVSEKILEEITTFWSKGDKFKEHGFLHRRGYLLHGPAGSGKTCLVQQIIADIVDNDGLVFQCTGHPQIFNDGLHLYRKVEPDRPIVCLFEDVDAIIDEHGEDDILTLLDGEDQIDKVLNIATTNYPEKLNARIVARPRRFDRVIKVGMPPATVRKLYFKEKLKVAKQDIDKWVKATNGFSFAACAELVISVCCFGKDFEESVEILRDMTDGAKPNSREYDEKGGVGFGNKKKDYEVS